MTDPSGRNNKNSSPPDLEELLRQIGIRLRTRGPSGAGGGGRLILMATLIVALLWLASGFHIIHEGERGVILRFGKLQAIEGSGLHWRLPYPVDELFIVNAEGVRTVEVGYRNRPNQKVSEESLMLTEEENIIDVQFAVQYVLADAKDYLFSLVDPDETVRHASESAIREVVGRHDMDFVLYEGRTSLASEVKVVIQTLLNRYRSGIRITSVTMQNAQPPEEVQAAFDDAVKAGQDRERQINEAQAYRNDILPKAKGMASRVVEEAEGYREKSLAEAQGNTARFDHLLPAYANNASLLRQRLYLETMEEVLSRNPKVIAEGPMVPLLPLLGLPKPHKMASFPPSDADALASPQGKGRDDQKTDMQLLLPEEEGEGTDTFRNRSFSYRERSGR